MRVKTNLPNCILCLSRPADSLEHIIPKAIGGKLSAFLLCTKCNNTLGSELVNDGDEPHEKTEKGGEKIITTSVFNFVNGQMLFLYNFMNVDLLTIYEDFVKNNNWKYKEIGKNGKMSCIGVKIFRKINNI